MLYIKNNNIDFIVFIFIKNKIGNGKLFPKLILNSAKYNFWKKRKMIIKIIIYRNMNIYIIVYLWVEKEVFKKRLWNLTCKM